MVQYWSNARFTIVRPATLALVGPDTRGLDRTTVEGVCATLPRPLLVCAIVLASLSGNIEKWHFRGLTLISLHNFLLGWYQISRPFYIRYPAGYPVSFAGYPAGRITRYPAKLLNNDANFE